MSDINKLIKELRGGLKSRPKLTPAQKMRLGRWYFINSDGNPEKRQKGIRLMKLARLLQNQEAIYYIDALILSDTIEEDKFFTKAMALKNMALFALREYKRADEIIKMYCRNRYDLEFAHLEKTAPTGPLVDFDGNPFVLHPHSTRGRIKASLEYKGGKNILTLSSNVNVIGNGDYTDEFYQAIAKGLKDWEGEYTVFGGQKLTVRLDVDFGSGAFNGIVVFPITNRINKNIERFNTRGIRSGEVSARVVELMRDRRSFASSGLIWQKWKIKKKKIIYLQSQDGRFDDYTDITETVRHEFGHLLGLGDLYEEQADGRMGIEYGTYPELDCYYLYNKNYYSVMCYSNALITNNEIEMVLLAYRDNEYQAYQLSKRDKKISAALGRGN